MRELLRFARRWLTPIIDPRRVYRGLVGYGHFFKDWSRYSKLKDAEPIRFNNAYPQLHERVPYAPYDRHYFFVNGWAMRRAISTKPPIHFDIGSQIVFANLLSAIIPTVFIDFRPLQICLEGQINLAGDLLSLPFADQSVSSISCLHVIEHIGLGRYGDPLDPCGTLKAVGELVRVLAPGGNLFIAVPVGRPRLEFNAHRIYTAERIRQMASRLELVEYSGVDDKGHYMECMNLTALDKSFYACGLFWFRRS